jgi:DNA-directed RNA polymerase subunit RPC12/RpoP
MVMWILIVVGIVVVAVVLGVIFSVESRRAQLDQSPLSFPEAPGMARGGAVGWEKFKCQECGAELGKDDVTAREGLTFVSCSYCGSTYQLVEEP